VKKKKISKNWLSKQKRDIFFKQSKIEGYRSRSAFKIIEMNQKFDLLKKNQLIIDLGCSPGGWSQVISKKVENGKFFSIDIKPMEKINNVNFVKGDFTDKNILNEITSYFNKPIDIILSDIAVNTTGNKSLDSYRTGELCISAMDLALRTLSINGIFLSKLFMGSIFEDIKKKANKSFKKVVIYKPLSSKKESKEIYIFCKGVLEI